MMFLYVKLLTLYECDNNNFSEIVHLWHEPLIVSSNSNNSKFLNLFLYLDIDYKNKLLKVLSINPFLPIVDKNNVLKRVLLTNSNEISPVYAVVMAGGMGKRLGLKTKNKPKPLVNVNGSPLLEHVLKKLELLNLRKTFISVHYLSEQIINYIQITKRQNTVKILQENQPLGTAGAIGQIPKKLDGQFLVTNCDILTNLDFL